MSKLNAKTSRFWKWGVGCAIGAPLLWFILAPFPGMAMIYAITDPLNGHPHRPHGEHPRSLVGLWVKEEPVESAMLANALALTADGKVARRTGMSKYSWHCEGSRLSLDFVSLCGNGYAGIVTQTLEVEFEGSDRVELKPVGSHRSRQVEGWYKRATPTLELRDEMQRRIDEAMSNPSQSGDDFFFAAAVLDAIDHLAPELAAGKEVGPLAQR